MHSTSYTAGMDYESATVEQNLTPFFSPATSMARVCVLNISIINDNMIEGTERFSVRLNSQSQGVRVQNHSAEINILDDGISSTKTKKT